MGGPDEMRYVRVFLLVLNVCPQILRKVFENYFIRNGSHSLQHFLDANKHNLYHLLCCRFRQSKTPLNRSQWDLLYTKNAKLCTAGHRGDCPCQYDAKPGITTKVMDVTLCCLILNNVSSGINLSHIHTIRDVRNKLVHNESANLDELNFYDYWNRVKTALIDLASHVSQTLHKETLTMVEHLETRMLDIHDLSGELRRFLVDEKKFKDLEESFKKKIEDIEEKVQQIEEHVNQPEMITERQQTDSGKTQATYKLKERLVEINEDMTKNIPISPLQARGEKELPLEELYASVVVCEDSKYAVKRRTIETGYCLRVVKAISLRLGLVRVGVMVLEQLLLIMLVVLIFVMLLGFYGVLMKITPDDLDEESAILLHLVLLLVVLLGSLLGLILMARLGIVLNLIAKEKLYLLVGSLLEGLLLRLVLVQMLVSWLLLDLELGLWLYWLVLDEGKGLGFVLWLGLVGVIGLGFASIYHYRNMVSKRFADVKIPAQQEIYPEDIFEKDGKITRNVYLLGDAARGKTTYSLWLTKQWCNALQKCSIRKNKVIIFEQTMNMFDFVFLLQLRHMDPTMASVVDMICFDLFEREPNYHATIRHVLSSDKYRSLIIIDGLDEWNPNGETRKQLKYQGMPNIKKVSRTVTCFFSMRPWVLLRILENIKINDRVIEIIGLSEAGTEHIIANVLINHYELKKGSSKYEETYTRITKHIDENNLKSFMQIPLLAVVCVQLWYERKYVGDSMTSFYTTMVDMIIERGHLKHDTHLLTQTTNSHLPNVLSAKKNIKHCIDVLIKLGKVAYEGMLSKQVKIIFQKESFKNEIGDRELQFALYIGLISQTEAPNILTTNVSVHFFHQTIQELLAAVYIVTQKDAIDSFRKHLSNVKVILELSNIIMFVCGMSPSLGSVLSKHIANVTDKDNDICLYRESPLENSGTVKELYQLHTRCYRELRHEQSDIPVPFYVSDIYLDLNSGTETVKTTRTLMKDLHCIIKSLFIKDNYIHYSITNRELDDFLSNKYMTRSMVMVCLVSYNFRCLQQICIPSLKTLCVTGPMFMTSPCVGMNPSLLMDLGYLKRYLLSFICGGVGLNISTTMVNIERIFLDNVDMTQEAWRYFIVSLSNLHHEFDVELVNTYIGNASKDLVKSSSFSIIQDTIFVRNVFRFRRI